MISANAARLVVAVELIHSVKEVCLHKKLARFCWVFFWGGGEAITMPWINLTEYDTATVQSLSLVIMI